MFRVILTTHAKYRLFNRKISLSRIKKVLKDGYFIKKDSNGTISKRLKFEDGKTLQVVYLIKENKFIIITFYYL